MREIGFQKRAPCDADFDRRERLADDAQSQSGLPLQRLTARNCDDQIAFGGHAWQGAEMFETAGGGIDPLFLGGDAQCAEFSGMLKLGAEAAFQHEDEPMVAAIQARMAMPGTKDIKQVLFKSDAGAVQARRVPERLIEAEHLH